MIITSDDENEKQTLSERLTAQFEMKDLGKLKYFFGIEVAYSRQSIFISQRKYILDLLKETGKWGCKTTVQPNKKLFLSLILENQPVVFTKQSIVYTSRFEKQS